MTGAPFKFLDAYEREDVARYFGRKRETAQLYNAVFAAPLTLLYGGSGTGKTSLVRCGLSNKFYESDWVPLLVKRGDNLLASLADTIQNRQVGSSDTGQAGSNPTAIIEGLNNLYYRFFRNIYLIFDQFEELLVEGTDAEQQSFYQTIRQILQESPNTKVLLVMREEWLGHLSAFERYVPTLFDNRLRIEPIRESVLWQRVIPGMIQAADIELRQPIETVPLIGNHIKDERARIDLTDLQVYLDRLYREATEQQQPKKPERLYFDPNLVKRIGEMRNVLSVFLDEQIAEMEVLLRERYGLEASRNVPLDILFTLVTNDRTKRAQDIDAILRQLPEQQALTPEVVQFCLEELQRRRLLNNLGSA